MTDTTEKTSPSMESVLLLVVDMQEPFLKAMPRRKELVKRCRFAIEAASLLSLRVAFTEQIPEKLGPADPSLLEAAADSNVFPKTAFSALGAPGLRDFLNENNISHLLLAGLETPICVYQTAIDSVNENLSLTVLSDCAGARRADDAAATIAALRTIGCHVLPSETVFYSILGDANDSRFRAFTKLVKQSNE